MKVYQALLSTHDFFFYVSKELKLGGPEPYISNTALLYALNRVEKVHRNVAGVTPFYEVDRKLFRVYVTPAALREEVMVIAGRPLGKRGIASNLVKVTYNSVIEGNVVFMEEKKLVLPKLGYYMKYPPLTTFEFFIIAQGEAKVPRVVRIGKKYPPARLYYREVKFRLREGRFAPSHPVNVLDLPEKTRIVEGRFISMSPMPLLVDCRLDGEYIKVEDEKKTYYIAMPDKQRYPGVFQEP